MTLSIGIVTNHNRNFSHTAQVGELATEMKAYAKTKQGSIFIVDRRHGQRDPQAIQKAGQAVEGTKD